MARPSKLDGFYETPLGFLFWSWREFFFRKAPIGGLSRRR